MQGKNWTSSECPICGREFPHKAGLTPEFCGRLACLQEANRRAVPENPQAINEKQVAQNRFVSDVKLEHLAQARDEAQSVLLKAIREDSQIAENMRDYWLHKNNFAEEN